MSLTTTARIAVSAASASTYATPIPSSRITSSSGFPEDLYTLVSQPTQNLSHFAHSPRQRQVRVDETDKGYVASGTRYKQKRYEVPHDPFAFALWRAHMRFTSTFGLTVMEPWECFLICTLSL